MDVPGFIKDDVVYPHRGFKGVKEIRILHDSLFWLDDGRPVLVFFLDRPLTGAPGKPPNPPSTVPPPQLSSWAELCKRYTAIGTVDHKLSSLLDDFREQVHDEVGSGRLDHPIESPRVHTSTDSDTETETIPGSEAMEIGTDPAAAASLDPLEARRRATEPLFAAMRQEVDGIVSGAIRAFGELPQSLLHRIGLETGLTGPEVEGMLERHIMTELYDLIFFKVCRATKHDDEDVASVVSRCRHVDVTQLGTTSSLDLRRRLALALDHFGQLGRRQSPQAKLEALLATMDVLMRNSEKSADDLIPLLVAVVLRGDVSNLLANLAYIQHFSFLDTQSGESGFAISTLEAVIYHINTSRRQLAATSSYNREFFELLTNGDLSAAMRMARNKPELVEVRDLQDRTPHQVANRRGLLQLLELPCSSSNLSTLLYRHLADDEVFDTVLDRVLDLQDAHLLINERDSTTGQTLAHRIYERPELIEDIGVLVGWRIKDKAGLTPLQVLAKVYDHRNYDTLLARALDVIPRPVHLQHHVDPKGNTLAHVANSVSVMTAILDRCDGDFDAVNDKGLTPLLTAAKFARLDVLARLLGHEKVDNHARDARGNAVIHYAARASLAMFNLCLRHGLSQNERTAQGLSPLHIAAREGNLPVLKRLFEIDPDDTVDLRGLHAGDVVRNDAVRVLLDEWACAGRDAKVLRPHVLDHHVMYLVKCRTGGGVLRSVDDFRELRDLLAARFPERAIPPLDLDLPDPLVITRLARSVTGHTVDVLDSLLGWLLADAETSSHPVLWEFILSPTRDTVNIKPKLDLELGSSLERIWREEKPLTDSTSTETFFAHASVQMSQLQRAFDLAGRRTGAIGDAQLNLGVAIGALSKELDQIAFEQLGDALSPEDPSPYHALQLYFSSTSAAARGLLASLRLPQDIAGEMRIQRGIVERCEAALNRSGHSDDPRPGLGAVLSLGLLADARARQRHRAQQELRLSHETLQKLGAQLRYLETTLADTLSQYWAAHEIHTRRTIQRLAHKQLIVERRRLAAIERSLKTFRKERDLNLSSDHSPESPPHQQSLQQT
ncbi:hypothetical protein PYCC9005_005480 [Savitreella phatthalungensis]